MKKESQMDGRATATRANGAVRAPHPVAHWVNMPTADGTFRLTMVWAVPNPVAPTAPHAVNIRAAAASTSSY